MKVDSLIRKSTVALMQTKSLESVTVEAILLEANVSKASFYRYFLDKYDVVNKIFDNMIPNEIGQTGLQMSLEESFMILFDVFGKNRRFLITALRSQESYSLTSHIKLFFYDFYKKYLLLYHANVETFEISNAIEMVSEYSLIFIKKWLNGRVNDSIGNIIDMLIAIIPNNIHQYFEGEQQI